MHVKCLINNKQIYGPIAPLQNSFVKSCDVCWYRAFRLPWAYFRLLSLGPWRTHELGDRTWYIPVWNELKTLRFPNHVVHKHVSNWYISKNMPSKHFHESNSQECSQKDKFLCARSRWETSALELSNALGLNWFSRDNCRFPSCCLTARVAGWTADHRLKRTRC